MEINRIFHIILLLNFEVKKILLNIKKKSDMGLKTQHRISIFFLLLINTYMLTVLHRQNFGHMTKTEVKTEFYFGFYKLKWTF